jgi:hypothetical protein
MRTLQKAGFVHVAGWLKAERAAEIKAEIEAEKPKVEEALKDES